MLHLMDVDGNLEKVKTKLAAELLLLVQEQIPLLSCLHRWQH